MRLEVERLIAKGHVPDSNSDVQAIRQWQNALEAITLPVTDEEAAALTKLLPLTDDDCFGLAWTLVHIVESAPGWPLFKCLNERANPWISLLEKRSSA